MFYFVLRVTCFTLCLLKVTRVSLCVEGYVFHFVLMVIRVSLCVEGYVFHFVMRVIRVSHWC